MRKVRTRERERQRDRERGKEERERKGEKEAYNLTTKIEVDPQQSDHQWKERLERERRGGGSYTETGRKREVEGELLGEKERKRERNKLP